MFKKLTILGLSAILLGGCTAADIFNTNKAAKDQVSAPVATSTPVPVSSPDTSLQVIPPTSNSNDINSLETDINNTMIIEEDLSDLN